MMAGIRAAAALLLLVAALLSSPPARAQETNNRCLLLGPLAISSFIATLEQVARSNRADGARQSANAANVIGLYEKLGCPQKALIKAIECLSSHVVKPAGKKPISAIAQQCMKQAGMPTR
jgi:hypothetical protein